MTNTDTDALRERLAETLHYGQGHDDWGVANDDERGEALALAAAVLPIVAEEVRKAKAEALRAWASGVESQLDATTSEGIDLGEWGRGLRSGVQQARDTAGRIETGDSDEHR